MKELIDEWEKAKYPSEFVIKLTKRIFNKNSKILDFGCGGGRNYYYLRDNYDAYACDRFQELVEHVRLKIPEIDRPRVVVNDVLKIPFPDKYFDGIILVGVIGLFDLYERTIILKEIARCLKTQGRFIIEFTGKGSTISYKVTSEPTTSGKTVYLLFNKQEIRNVISEISDSFDIGYEEFFFGDNKEILRRWYTYGSVKQ